MGRSRMSLVLTTFLLVATVLAGPSHAETLVAFLGSATKPAMDEINRLFTSRTGVDVTAQYGGSGKLLAQMQLSHTGDVYLSGSPDFMEKAKREGFVDSSTEKIIAYLVPAITVQTGNPKNIKSLQDLSNDSISLVIANPQSVCVGLYAVEVFEASKLSAVIKPRIRSYVESCEQTANVIALGAADAVMGWDVFEHWNPDKIQTIFLKPDEIPRIAYIPLAVSTFTQNRKRAEEYIDLVVSAEGKAIFKKWGYFTDEQEARTYAPHARIGGEYTLPEGW
ncbi:MAG TPA: molybdate ABC transporter substrate-binding protein [Thermodesulfobacteriota bacterium]|nr:molybdate ABC transporter substrate-binding protein [Thermodesulfobacteriota bacterium]